MSMRFGRLAMASRVFVAFIALGTLGLGLSQAAEPKNVILLIGDGMGPSQVAAAGIYANGQAGSLFMETLPRKAEVVTCPAYRVSATAPATMPAKITDSAAAASAYATGQKAYNGVLSIAMPGDGMPLKTALDIFQAAGKSTGLVTTSYLVDATPAAFAAHVKDRDMHAEIAADMLQTRPNILLGGNSLLPKEPKGGKTAFTAEVARSAGFTVATNRAELLAIKPAIGDHTLGIFGVGPMPYEYDYQTKAKNDYDTLPHLSEMAMWTLDCLSANPKGFFVMIEAGCIDKACHSNKLPQAIGETIEFDKTVKQVCQWAANRDDTLVIVLADHETGGLKVVANNGPGQLPTVTWTSYSHSGANVPCFATGPGSQAIAGVLDNTDIFRIMAGTFTAPTVYHPQTASCPADEEQTVGKD
jgi:alkaline phosphatase